jgi:SnoaL-like domain
MWPNTLPPRGRLRTMFGVALGVCACVTILMATSRTPASAHPGPRDSVPRSVQLQLSRLEVGQRRLEAAQQASAATEAELKYDEAIAEDKLEITQQQSLYGLLFNGDGPDGPNRVLWGQQIFTGDGPFLAYDSNLQLIPSQSFTHMSDEIASAVATQPATWPDTSNPNGSMHYMFAPVFRSITLDTAVTDTPSMSVNAVKGTQKVNSITIRVYHDTWVKTAEGWRKTTSTWYRLD